MLYTWDFMRLRNLAPLDGREAKSIVENPKTLPTWLKGLASRETRALTQAEIRGLPFSNQARHEVVDRILPEGKAWIEAVYEDLEKRFPHGEEGPGFFCYESSRGVCLIYDPGVDMHSEWSKIFGVTAPPFTDCWRAPLAFRPWKSTSSGSPTVFFDGNREDWASTDSLGAPYFSKTSVQTQIDWAYVLTEEAENLLPGILKTLGRAAVAWQCRVQPPAR